MVQKTYEFFTKRVGINEESTVTDQSIQQILALLGSTVLPAAEAPEPAITLCASVSVKPTSTNNETARLCGFIFVLHTSDHEVRTPIAISVFRFHPLARRPCPKRIFFASSVIPGGAGLIVFANAYAR
jgi:hypothetical protein